jgi:hypothetical protein
MSVFFPNLLFPLTMAKQGFVAYWNVRAGGALKEHLGHI